MINWLVTDMHFAFILIILLLIFFVISMDANLYKLRKCISYDRLW